MRRPIAQGGRGTLPRCFPPLLLALLLTASLPAAPLKLRVLETTDLHMYLLAWDYFQDQPTEDYGLARTAPLIKAARAEVKNSLLFDNGDLLQGSPLGDYVAKVRPLPAGAVHPAMRVLNALGVDAGNIGNHDFNFGLPFLRQAIAGAAFPYVSANTRIDDGDGNPANDPPAFNPYVILERTFTDEAGAPQKLRVGVIGFVPPQILIWDRAHLSGRITVHDIVESARRYVPEIRARGADLVIAIPHSGFERGESSRITENSVARLVEVPGIDAILFGHSHGEFPGPSYADFPGVNLARGTINGVPAVMPGRWGDHLGVIDLVLVRRADRWQVTDSRAEIRPIRDRATRRALVAPDPLVENLVREEHAGTLRYMRDAVAHTRTPITSYFAQVADDPSVQLVAQAQLAYVRRAVQGTDYETLPLLSAAAPFKAGGRQGWKYYTDIPAGEFTMRNVADLYIYPNLVNAVKVRGATVREWLEMSAGQFNRIDPRGPRVQDLINDGFRSYQFDSIEGVTYAIDVTQPARYAPNGNLANPAARRIVELRYAGRPLDDAATLLVVTNSYRATGGGNFPGLDGSNIVVDAPDETREAIVRHLQAAGEIDPTADANWRILPVPGVSLRFVSGAGGIKYLERYPQIRLVQENGDGSAVYELVPRSE
jgi:2',3'-cyclic-nucleotide 2'-phosphodiesterase/3'-nucleotidase